MCGIVGITSSSQFSVKDELLSRLKKLEYRGYDSVGFATSDGTVIKGAGELDGFISRIPDIKTKTAISHTRWATHGGVTDTNAHPHFDEKREIFIVHNGIIENFSEMKAELQAKGYRFSTQTDSEVIAHFFADAFKDSLDWIAAAKKFLKKAKGTFAILLIKKGEERIYALKRDSPLTLGLAGDMLILASDIYAFSDKTNKAIFFNDDEFAIVHAGGYEFYNAEGNPIKKEIKEFKWSRQEEDKHEHPHYMIKEIHEQPIAAERLIRSLESEQAGKVARFVELIKNAERVVFTAAGTSYFATLLGVYFLNKQNIMAHTLIASEFENYVYVNDKTLVIAVSQSGETMDVVSALKYAKAKGARIASIVNVPYSTVQRMSDVSIEIMAGQEVCVAATKTFTNQVITLLFLASKFGFNVDFGSLPLQIEKTIANNEEKVKELAQAIYKKNDIYILGRGLSYPSAREFAHKLKEIAYVHAEGMMGGELKHGTLALIDEGTPVFSLIADNDIGMINNTKEVEARGAKVYKVSAGDDADFQVPATNRGVFSILAVIIGQLLAYYIAVQRGLPIDKPRHLAKSVTVK